MPQLDPSSYPSQLFWLFVCVTALFLFMWKVAVPNIGNLVEMRKAKVESDIADAETMRVAAEEAKAEYEKILSDARAEGMKFINESIRKVEKEGLVHHRELEKNTESQIAEAEKRISRAKAEAMEKLAPVAEEVTSVIVNKLLNLDLNQKDVKKAVSSLKDAA